MLKLSALVSVVGLVGVVVMTGCSAASGEDVAAVQQAIRGGGFVTMSGTFWNAANNRPIASVNICIEDHDGNPDRCVLTNAAGSYSLDVPANGHFNVRIVHPSFLPMLE